MCKEGQKLQETSQDQLRKFTHYFCFFWIGMLALYIGFCIQSIAASNRNPVDGRYVPVLDGKGIARRSGTENSPPDSANGGAILGTIRNVSAERQPQSNAPAQNQMDRKQGFKGAAYPFVNFLLNNLGFLFAFWCFLIFYLPSGPPGRHNLLRNYSCLTFLLFTASFPLLFFLSKSEGARDYAIVFNAVSGTLNAVALALLIARLDSKLIGVPSLSISALYLYPAIQPFFALFNLEPTEKPVFGLIELTALILAFIFKLYFFLLVVYLLQSGRIRNYLICFPYLNERVNSIFDNQFEIKIQRTGEHFFSFSILEKNKLVYFTDTMSASREDCDKRVGYIRDLMKNEGRYSPTETCGTYWIRITNWNGSVLCQSVSLRSKDEADKLVKRSLEKVPYCKYDRG
jgi:hypothetical protein